MKYSITKILIVFLTIFMTSVSLHAEIVSKDEALTVARNWVTIIINKKGSWGGSKSAAVLGCQEFKRGDLFLGYFCPVSPIGYVVLSPLKELIPIQAYSYEGNLDPNQDEGMTALFKDRMQRILNSIDSLVGPYETVNTNDLLSVMKKDYRQSWEKIRNGVDENYQEGDSTMLTTRWEQDWPYNYFIEENSDCSWHEYHGHCAAGCTAVAGAQVMRYWCWPPYDGYGYTPPWTNMPNALDWDSPQDSINNVAGLIWNVGVAITNYCSWYVFGCASWAEMSSSFRFSLEDELQARFGYSESSDYRTRAENQDEWWGWIMLELNQNRPLLYEIGSVLGGDAHIIVLDGWEYYGANPQQQYVHVNYGWGDSNLTWFSLDHIPGSGYYLDEHMLVHVYPEPSFGSCPNGVYPCNDTFPYRYFDQDANSCEGAVTIGQGQKLQFLPKITVTGMAPIHIQGNGESPTLLFSRGDQTKGIRITGYPQSAEVRLMNGGAIKFP